METDAQTIVTSYIVEEDQRIQKYRRPSYEPLSALVEYRKGERIEFVRTSSSETLTQSGVEQLAQLYAASFGAAPWFEVGKCYECGYYYPNEGIKCPRDGTLVTEAYPALETAEYELSVNLYMLFV